MNVQRTDTASQSLMRSYLVKLLTKAVKGSLLRTQVPFGGRGRGGFQGPVHPFMTTILLRTALVDAIRGGSARQRTTARVRATCDLDAIAQVLSRAEYYQLARKLKGRGRRINRGLSPIYLFT